MIYGRQIKSNAEFSMIREKSVFIPMNREILILIPMNHAQHPPPPFPNLVSGEFLRSFHP